ncbi:MAG: hypothetical protein QM765_35050 [Myxococcales bacterium]
MKSFQAACKDYDPGHRLWEKTTFDQLIDKVFLKLGPDALAALLTKCDDGALRAKGDGMDVLFAPAFAGARGKTEAALLKRLTAYVKDLDDPKAVAALLAKVQKAASPASRKALQALVPSANALADELETVLENLSRTPAKRVDELLLALGKAIPDARAKPLARKICYRVFRDSKPGFEATVSVIELSLRLDGRPRSEPLGRLFALDPQRAEQYVRTRVGKDAKLQERFVSDLREAVQETKGKAVEPMRALANALQGVSPEAAAKMEASERVSRAMRPDAKRGELAALLSKYPGPLNLHAGEIELYLMSAVPGQAFKDVLALAGALKRIEFRRYPSPEYAKDVYPTPPVRTLVRLLLGAVAGKDPKVAAGVLAHLTLPSAELASEMISAARSELDKAKRAELAQAALADGFDGWRRSPAAKPFPASLRSVLLQ